MLHLNKPLSLRNNLNPLNAALFLTVFMAASSFAIPITQYTFDGNVQTASSVAANATASTFTLNTGAATFVAGNPGQAITGSSGWTGVDGAKFWEFTVTANVGYVLDLSSLTFDDQRSGSGPLSWTLVINGTPIVSSQATHTAIAMGNNSVDLSALTLQNLTSADVKISGFGASSGSGTWRVDNVTLNGTVASTSTASVPDSLPFAFAAMALAGVVLLHLGRERLTTARVRS